MSDFPSFSWCEYSFWLVSLAFLGIMEALEAWLAWVRLL